MFIDNNKNISHVFYDHGFNILVEIDLLMIISNRETLVLIMYQIIRSVLETFDDRQVFTKI